MAPYIGQPFKRFEDPRLLTGRGTFVDDVQLPGMLHAAILRSPHAHARLLGVDVAAARALPGVVTVLTAQGLAGAVQDIPPRPTRELAGAAVPGHPILARDTVRYVGQPVAVVVARDRYGVQDALALLQATYDPLSPLPDPQMAVRNDAPLLPAGQGTFASRGMTLGGSSMYLGVQQARQKMARLAAHLLDGQPDDLVFQEGVIAQAQHPERRLAFAEVAAAAYRRDLLPPGMEEGLTFPVQFVLTHNPFGFGAHVVVVEIDRDTGALQILRYVAVHDCGRVINPKLLEGQVYGAIAQGLGQALGEQMVYGPDGQPHTASLLAYPLPRARDTLRLITATQETPSPTNPLQLKGVGELPTVACAAAVVNAALDALSGTTVRHLDAPLTAHKLWQALQQP